MKTTSTFFLLTMLFVAMAVCPSANADTLIAGFETGLQGFGGNDPDGGGPLPPLTTSLGATGATEGAQALQFDTNGSTGGFNFASSFSFFDDDPANNPLAINNPANTSVKYDVLFTPDDIDNQVFLQVTFGINSNAASNGGRNPEDNFQFVGEGTAGGGTQSSGTTIDLVAGQQTSIEQFFSDLPDPDLSDATFAGIFFVVNTNVENTGVLSIDNIRLHVAAVPEPSSLALLCSLGLLGVLRRRK